MLYAIGKTKIVRADNDGNTVAEVHFHETRPHVYEITEVLTAAPDDDDQDLDKLMNKMVQYMRKNENRVTTSDEYAVQWFEEHAECQDILARRHEGEHRQKHHEASREKAQRESYEESRREERTRGSYEEPRREERTREPYDETRHNQRTREDDYDERGISSDELPSRGARTFGRVLQFLCAICMAAITVLYVMSAMKQINEATDSLTSMPTGLNVFRISCIGFLIYGAAMTIWILSRRRFLVDGRKVRLDGGRGILGFALILIVLILAPTFLSYVAGAGQASAHYEIFLGLAATLTIFYTQATYATILSIAGLIMSVVRQFVGR